jgi:signal transduction histidine kinase
MRHWGWILLFFAFSIEGKAVLLEDEPSYNLSPYVTYFEDAKSDLNVTSVLKQTFKQNAKESINFGFTHCTYWFKVPLKRVESATSKSWWLSIAYPLLDKVDIYFLAPDNTIFEHHTVGLIVDPTTQKPILHNFMTQLHWGNHTEITLLVRVTTQGSMQVPMSIYSSVGYFEEAEYSNVLIGIFYGIFVVIFLYNVIFYFYTRDSNYLRYLLFLTSFILWQMSFDGIGRIYFWGNWHWMLDHGRGVWMAFSAFSALCFGREFLQTKIHIPRFDILLKSLMWLAFGMTFISAFFPYGEIIFINTPMVITAPILLLISGFYVMKKTDRIARFYLAGWSSFLIGTIVFALNKFEIIPSFQGVNHVQQIGAAIEMVFLSWALADRVYRLQSEYVEKLNTLNETLGEKVTLALNEMRKKDELFVQQSRFAALGEMIEQIAHQWRQPLNTLSLINQNLYFKRQLGECSDIYYDESHAQFQEHLQYMSKTIDDFRNYYKMDKLKEAEDISSIAHIALRLSEVLLNDAKIKASIINKTDSKVFLAKNEMIQVFMNLIKNANDVIVERRVADAKITITIEQVDEYIEILVDDNGGGIDEAIVDDIFTIYFTTKSANQGTGLGLHMCKYIIEESFGGTIRVENYMQGARFIIRLPIAHEDSFRKDMKDD